MRRAFFSTLVVIFGTTLCIAQTTGRLTGTIRAKADKRPLPDATIKISSKDSAKVAFTVKTDKKGVYSQIGLTPGSYVIEVSLDGFLPESAEWKVKLAEVTSLDFEMTEIPKAAAAPKEGPGAADFRQASQLYDSGKYSEAADTLARALAAEPNHPVYLLKLGLAYVKLGKPSEAEAAFGKVVQADGSSFSGWFNLGQVRMDQKNYVGAEEAFDHATKLEGNEAEAFFDLGAARINQSKQAEAVPALERALQIKPDHLLALYWLGTAYLGLGKNADAKAAFEKFLLVAPANDPNVPQVKQFVELLKKM